MKLNPGEQSILAFFSTSAKAARAMEALRAAGIGEASLDRVSRYGVEADREFNNPLAGQAQTVTGLTLFSAGEDPLNDNDTRVLLGSDPSVHGMAGEGYGLAGGKSFLVTVVTRPEKADQAVAIIKEHGGTV